MVATEIASAAPETGRVSAQRCAPSWKSPQRPDVDVIRSRLRASCERDGERCEPSRRARMHVNAGWTKPSRQPGTGASLWARQGDGASVVRRWERAWAATSLSARRRSDAGWVAHASVRRCGAVFDDTQSHESAAPTVGDGRCAATVLTDDSARGVGRGTRRGVGGAPWCADGRGDSRRGRCR
jgi:hypothetical protein